jgi:hypothetical protein
MDNYDIRRQFKSKFDIHHEFSQFHSYHVQITQRNETIYQYEVFHSLLLRLNSGGRFIQSVTQEVCVSVTSECRRVIFLFSVREATVSNICS